MEDKIVIVTGGTRGIGKAISISFCKAGAKVYALGRNLPENKSDFSDDADVIKNINFVKVDITDLEAVADAFADIAKTDRRIDILVNNAGITRDNIIFRMSEYDWDQVIDTNLKGAFICIKAVARVMMGQRYGRIINIGSIVGSIGNPGQANYSASKAGMMGLTKSVAKELASRNITCNLIAPGYVETDMTESLSEEQKQFFINNIPLGRVANADEIADVVLFFASDKAKYITGQVLHVDGGLAI